MALDFSYFIWRKTLKSICSWFFLFLNTFERNNMSEILVQFKYETFDLNIVAYKIFSESNWEKFLDLIDEDEDYTLIIGETDLKISGKKYIELCDVLYNVKESDVKILQKLNLELDCFNIFNILN